MATALGPNQCSGNGAARQLCRSLGATLVGTARMLGLLSQQRGAHDSARLDTALRHLHALLGRGREAAA